MNTVHKFPVSQLPAKLRGDFKDDQLVTIMIASDDDAASYDAWLKDLVQSLRESQQDIKAGRGIPADQVFADMRTMIAAKADA